MYHKCLKVTFNVKESCNLYNNDVNWNEMKMIFTSLAGFFLQYRQNTTAQAELL